jgi:hypothetical protein
LSELVGDLLEFGPDVLRVRVHTQSRKVLLGAPNASFVVRGASLVIAPERPATVWFHRRHANSFTHRDLGSTTGTADHNEAQRSTSHRLSAPGRRPISTTDSTVETAPTARLARTALSEATQKMITDHGFASIARWSFL